MAIDCSESTSHLGAVSRLGAQGLPGHQAGLVPVGFHYAMDDIEAGFVMDAVEFVADHGHRFLRLYAFDPATGAWSHREYQETHAAFSLDAALQASGCDETAWPADQRAKLYAACLAQASDWARRLGELRQRPRSWEEMEFGELQFSTSIEEIERDEIHRGGVRRVTLIDFRVLRRFRSGTRLDKV